MLDESLTIIEIPIDTERRHVVAGGRQLEFLEGAHPASRVEEHHANAGDTIEHALSVIRRTGYTRYPVRDRPRGAFIGALHAKDLLGRTGRRQLKSVAGIIRPLYLAPETRTIDSQLRSFKRRRIHQALATDEGGAITGLITLEDILEEMVGSIEDEFDYPAADGD